MPPSNSAANPVNRLESWADIPGYEGYYQVSDQGRIRSLHRGTMRILSLYTRPKRPKARPYQVVALHRNGAARTHLVHRLVLSAFAGEAGPGAEGCHKNDDACDNRLVNLYWGTRSENILDAVDNGGFNRWWWPTTKAYELAGQ